MNFIEKLYHDGIYPSEQNTRPVLSEYDELQGNFFVLHKQLQESLNSEQKDMLSRIMEIKLLLQSLEMATCFANGFRLGGRLIAEIFKDKE